MELFSYEQSIFNTSKALDKFSEIDYSLSINYPVKVYGKFGIDISLTWKPVTAKEKNSRIRTFGIGFYDKGIQIGINI